MQFSNQFTTLNIIENYIKESHADDIVMSELLNILNERAFGVVLLFLSLPNAIGLAAIPGLSTLLGIPIILVSLRMISGNDHLPLPKKFEAYKVSRKNCLKFITQSRPYVEKLEKLTKPRALWFSNGIGLKLTGVISFILGLIIALPIPFGNFLGGAGLLILALGLTQDDGLFIFISYVLTTIICYTLLSVATYLFYLAQEIFIKFFA